jgi:hypothetical protein
MPKFDEVLDVLARSEENAVAVSAQGYRDALRAAVAHVESLEAQLRAAEAFHRVAVNQRDVARAERGPWPGEGTWSVFSEKVVKERDEARNKLSAVLRASWQLINDLGDARRLMGLDFPPEVEAATRSADRLVSVIMGKD